MDAWGELREVQARSDGILARHCVRVLWLPVLCTPFGDVACRSGEPGDDF